MSEAYKGGCLCGAVRYSFTGDLDSGMVCHRRNCQKQAGSAFSIILSVPADKLETTGTVTSYNDTGDSGGRVVRQFCNTCGSPVFTRVDAAPDNVFIKAGSLDDPTDFKPQMQFWTSTKQPWVEMDLPGTEKNPA